MNVHLTYRADRRYWRERVQEIAPNLTARETISAAHLLAALYASDQDEIAKADREIGWQGSPFDPAAGASASGKVRELSAVWQRLAPADIAQRALALALDRPSDGKVPAITPAPDPYSGVTHAVVSKRSNSGRTDRKVVQSGVAIVQGSPERQPDRFVVRQAGTWRTVPARFAGVRCQRARRCQIAGEPAFVAVTGSLFGALAVAVLETVPRRGAGANALAVTATTNRVFDLPAISDLREWREITPELPELSVAGIAEHRSDITGSRGALTSPEALASERQRRAPAPRLAVGRAPILRDSERTYASASALPAPADRPRSQTEQSERRTERDWIAPAAFPTRERLTYASRANASAEPTPAPASQPERIWIGHTLRVRGERARQPGKRSQRLTLDASQHPTDSETLTALAANLNRGERVKGVTPAGKRWSITRSDSGRYSLAYAGKRTQRTTPDAIGRTLADRLAST